MAYGKEEVKISSVSPVVKQREEAAAKDIKTNEGILPAYIDEEGGNEFTQEFYKENPDQPYPHEIGSDSNGNATYNIKKSDKYASKRREGKVIVTQSLIKKLVSKFQVELEFCPRHIKEIVLDKKRDFTREQMLSGDFPELLKFTKGKLFESLFLGSTTDHAPINDMPRNKRKGKLFGTKTLDQERIETQAEIAKLKAKELGAEIITGVNTHVTLFKRWDEKYMLACELDWFPVIIFYEGYHRLAMIDVKLTGDINSSFGDFGWAKPQDMDLVQGDFYHMIVRDVDLELNSHVKDLFTERVIEIIKNNDIIMLFWVFGIKEPLHEQERMIERLYQEQPGNNHRQNELRERIRKVTAILDREEHFGWQERPCSNCSTCPLHKKYGGDCESSIITRV